MAKVTFTISPAPVFTAPVKIPRAGADPAEISITFRHKTREQMNEFIERSSKAKKEEDVPLLMEIIEGWAGPDLPLSEESVGQLIENYQSAPMAITATYIAELTQGRRKN